jgi:hypothetical protein
MNVIDSFLTDDKFVAVVRGHEDCCNNVGIFTVDIIHLGETEDTTFVDEDTNDRVVLTPKEAQRLAKALQSPTL